MTRRSPKRFGQVRPIVVQAQAEPGRWLIVVRASGSAGGQGGTDRRPAADYPADRDDAMESGPWRLTMSGRGNGCQTRDTMALLRDGGAG